MNLSKGCQDKIKGVHKEEVPKVIQAPNGPRKLKRFL